MFKHLYSAFGMRITSAIPLPLPSAITSLWPVEIVEGLVPEQPDLPYLIGQIRYGRVRDTIQFDIPWAARYSLEGDSRIVVERVPGAREDFAGLYLSGLIFAVLLGKRDIITLHGSAVTSGTVVGSGGSLVFIGDKGAGKSTTAAALAAYGYRILCDDVIPIATGPLVLPGIPLSKLLPDAYETLIGDPSDAAHLFDGVNKYHVELPSSVEPAPLRAIFALEIAHRTDLCIEPIKGATKIQRVLQNTMSLQGIDDPVSVFTRCAERFAAVPCYRVLRPAGKNCLDELAGAIIALDRKIEAGTNQMPETGEAQ